MSVEQRRSELQGKRCQPCEAGTPPLPAAAIAERAEGVPEWECDGRQLARTFRFKNFHQTMAFVNAVAWIAHRENHHPDLAVSYNACRVSYTTHAIGGLSENDFICAAKVDGLQAD